MKDLLVDRSSINLSCRSELGRAKLTADISDENAQNIIP